jgi:hypothetical protein
MTIPHSEADNAVPLYPVATAIRPRPARWYFRVNLVALAMLLVALGLARTARVVDEQLFFLECRVPETCMSKLLLGRPCIGCGITRSVVLAVAGQWSQSRACHPSGVWLAGWLLLEAVTRIMLLVARPGRLLVWRVDLTLSLAGLFAVLYVPVFVAHWI